MEILNKNIFGLNFQAEEINTKGLPVFMTAQRSFFRMSYNEIAFLCVQLSKEERFGIVALEKQLSFLSNKYGIPVVFGFSAVTKLQRDKLLERNIPFITDNGQLYLPFLGMMLNNTFKKEKETRRDKMMPVTQLLFLYMLYKSKGQAVMKKDAAAAIGVTRTSITRASEQLVAMGLISQEIQGKEYYMRTEMSDFALYKKAKPYLINPIQRILIMEADYRYSEYVYSGESALSKVTMLNEPKIPVRAVYKADFKADNIKEIDPKWITEEKPLCLELWKYNPAMFANDGIVDPVSLSNCFDGNADERIEEAVEEYLEGQIWGQK